MLQRRRLLRLTLCNELEPREACASSVENLDITYAIVRKQKELVKAMTLGHAEAIQEISEGHDRSDSEEPERDGTGPESPCSINRVASVNLKEKVTIIDDGASFKEVPIVFGRYEGKQPLDPISSMTVVRQDLFDDYCINGTRKPAKLVPRDNLDFQGQTYQLSEPEEISLSVDGVEILTKACVVMDQNFPRPLVIGKNDLVAQGWKGPWDKPGTIGLLWTQLCWFRLQVLMDH